MWSTSILRWEAHVTPIMFKALLMNRSTLALAIALAASPVFAGQDYPPGLFENSPVVPSVPPTATGPSGPTDGDVPLGPPSEGSPFGPPDAVVPFGPPDVVGPPDDYCASVAFRTFRSQAEVRQAHARCDPGRGDLPPPLPDEWPR
jgi:hypothetical protein